MDRLPLFFDIQDLEVPAENRLKIPLPKKPVVVTIVHHPIPFSFFIRMVFEARRKTGKEKVAPRLENRTDVPKIALRIPTADVMETAVIENNVECFRPEGEMENISEHESEVCPGRSVPGDPARPL